MRKDFLSIVDYIYLQYTLKIMGLFNSKDKRQVRRDVEADGWQPRYNARTAYSEQSKPLPVGKPEKHHHRGRRIAKVLFGLVLLTALAVGGTYLYITKIPLKGETSGRVNILVLGVDDAASLSDTIMLLSIDTRDKAHPKAATISIPRDLYVEIPKNGTGKINSAYTYGQNNKYPGGGPALSKKVIEDSFDLPIHYYLTMDFTGFKQLIDTVGGVDVEVKTAINDPYYPAPGYNGYQPFSIEAGRQHMNGEVALAYARSRQTTTDFDRAARQQQILAAFKDKVLSTDSFSRDRYQAFQTILKDHVQTDMSRREMVKAGLIARKINSNFTQHVIDTSNFLTPSQRYGYALVPNAGVDDYSEIAEFIDNIFSQAGNNLPKNQQ
jgi:polyisoprenyl-teichoic acid--peptidoglycan teichoic acid transferase